MIAEGHYKEIDREDIQITNQLGIGEFGPIFDAEVKLSTNDVQRAMIKVANRSFSALSSSEPWSLLVQVFQQGTSQDLVRFREEVERLKGLDHPQVGRLFGVVSKSPYYMITELTINGDLKNFLLTSAEREDSEGNPA